MTMAMRLTAPRVRVLFERGQDVVDATVQADNRDLIAWDVTRAKKGWPADVQSAPFLWATFLAWSALRRTGQTDLGLDAFLDVCLEAGLVRKDAADDGDAVDPTQPAAESA